MAYMSVINRKRLRQWKEAIGVVKNDRLRMWMNLAKHLSKLRVNKRVWFRRMKSCMKCPLYHPFKKTCGHDPEITGLGCGCYMPFKAMSTEATCWARDRGMLLDKVQIGWEDGIDDISDMKGSGSCHNVKPFYSDR